MKRLLIFLIPLLTAGTLPARTFDADICVYGGTSGGVIAAVQAARMGQRVILLEPGNHLGGMTSGGLSAVDIGNPRTVGGLTREYFTRLAGQYGRTLAWDKKLKGVPTGGAFAVEPHSAEQLFNDFIKEAGVPVHFNQRIVRATKMGARITAIRMDNGDLIHARMFIDTTYEGDLMAKAGVSYTLQREANSQYGETLNGVQFDPKYKPLAAWGTARPNGRRADGKGLWDRDIPLNPFTRPDDPLSPVLPLVDPGPIGPAGSAAPGVQAYCFRLCLTDQPTNRIPIPRPANYDPERYELVARFIAACEAAGDDLDLRTFSKYDPLPGGKYDFNTATFGGNLPGASWAWPEADWKQRAVIARQHEDYHRGLLHFLATDHRVPEKVRREMNRFGLCRDEFPDTGGWPHQIYVREARRMVSDLVMTEKHCRGTLLAPKAIGLGSYGMDLHEIRRVIHDGMIWREGKLGAGVPWPYPIGYDAIVPRAAECENLFVTFALSASHVAFGSIRMEPPFMIHSQSAATAAALAIDDASSVQSLDYAKLSQRLSADGQILAWKREPRASDRITDRSGIIVDDAEATFIGNWTPSGGALTTVGRGYRHDANSSREYKTATFATTIVRSGHYDVRLLYGPHANRGKNVPITVHYSGGQQLLSVDQSKARDSNGRARSLGTYRFETGQTASVTIGNRNARGYVAADGVQWAPVARTADQIVGKDFDLVVIEGTPGGIACAIRAAREGLKVLLVNRTEHLGGIVSSGLGVWDTVWEGKRSPIYDELRQGIFAYYRTNYGEKSTQFRHALPGKSGHTNGKFEPRVIEQLITDLVNHEPNITLLTGHIPVRARRQGRLIKALDLREFRSRRTVTVPAKVFADCSYEGDLLPLADVPYRVGREARSEFDEPHAGKAYLRPTKTRSNLISDAQWNAHESLPVRKFGGFQEIVLPESTGEGDRNVQAFNFRTILTSNPTNRIPVGKPADYDPEFLKTLEYGSLVQPIPNQKIGWNRPQLIGPHQVYVEGDWDTRQQVMNAHWQAAMSLLWFLQHDPGVPAKKRMFWLNLGLAKDEFRDNHHRPYEIYVREARRLTGRYTLTQHDLMPVPGTTRPPKHKDAIAMTDWYMDSHAVTPGKVRGSLDEGKMMLHAETWPGQIPYRCLLPKDLDNLLIPVCLSATHVAWGAIRLEPTWMQTGEAAGYAAALAIAGGTQPGTLPADQLVSLLAANEFLIDFHDE